jgi:TM2 domain-containing membrane protein YozV
MRGDLELIGNEILIQLGMTAAQQAEFDVQMSKVRKSRARAKWLAALFGAFGAHHFYLEQRDRGIQYACFCWTGVTLVLSLWELRTLGLHVDRYNAVRARAIAQRIKARAVQRATPRGDDKSRTQSDNQPRHKSVQQPRTKADQDRAKATRTAATGGPGQLRTATDKSDPIPLYPPRAVRPLEP